MANEISRALNQANIYDYFISLPPSHQREYLEWIASAKKDSTRQNRIKKTVEMLLAKLAK